MNTSFPLKFPILIAAAGLVLAGCSTPAKDSLELAESRYAGGLRVNSDTPAESPLARYRAAFDADAELFSKTEGVKARYDDCFYADLDARAWSAVAGSTESDASNIFETEEVMIAGRNDRWLTDKTRLDHQQAYFHLHATPVLGKWTAQRLSEPAGYAGREALFSKVAAIVGERDPELVRLKRLTPDTAGLEAEKAGDLVRARTLFLSAFESDRANVTNRAKQLTAEQNMASARAALAAAHSAETGADLTAAVGEAERAVTLWALLPDAKAYRDAVSAKLARVKELAGAYAAAMSEGRFTDARKAVAEAITLQPDGKARRDLATAWKSEVEGLAVTHQLAEAWLASRRAGKELAAAKVSSEEIAGGTKALFDSVESQFLTDMEASPAFTGSERIATSIEACRPSRNSSPSTEMIYRMVLSYDEKASVNEVDRKPMTKVVQDKRMVSNPAYEELKNRLSRAESHADSLRSTRNANGAMMAVNAFGSGFAQGMNQDASSFNTAAAQAKSGLDNSNAELDAAENEASAIRREMNGVPSQLPEYTERTVRYSLCIAEGLGDARLTITFPEGDAATCEASCEHDDTFTENPSPADGIPVDNLDLSEAGLRRELLDSIVGKFLAKMEPRLAAHALKVHEARLALAKEKGTPGEVLAARARLAQFKGDVAGLDALMAAEPWVKPSRSAK